MQEYLPADQLALIEPSSLEICKDSFIEKELEDYFSDMLYKVRLSETPGYLYVLFEHKSYDDKYLHLQLLEYMLKIWRLFLKQQPKKKKKPPLPIVLPLLIYHGERPWPKERIRFSSLMSGPVASFSAYIPDFSFRLHDLTGFTDDEIRGTIMGRVMQLLFKHKLEVNET
nr:Rpn family recombination-promoting nuclease/putative transposase [Desulfamplus magnetovallimortis]